MKERNEMLARVRREAAEKRAKMLTLLDIYSTADNAFTDENRAQLEHELDQLRKMYGRVQGMIMERKKVLEQWK